MVQANNGPFSLQEIFKEPRNLLRNVMWSDRVLRFHYTLCELHCSLDVVKMQTGVHKRDVTKGTSRFQFLV